MGTGPYPPICAFTGQGSTSSPEQQLPSSSSKLSAGPMTHHRCTTFHSLCTSDQYSTKNKSRKKLPHAFITLPPHTRPPIDTSCTRAYKRHRPIFRQSRPRCQLHHEWSVSTCIIPSYTHSSPAHHLMYGQASISKPSNACIQLTSHQHTQ